MNERVIVRAFALLTLKRITSPSAWPPTTRIGNRILCGSYITVRPGDASSFHFVRAIQSASESLTGRQCNRLAEIVHHLISPRRDPSKMYSYTNCVGLCRQCHPNDEGTPDWIAGKDYVPTVAPTFHF